jgi:hypothetical protein
MSARDEARAALAQADQYGYDLGAFDRLRRGLRALLDESVPSVEEWGEAIIAERARHPEKGYTAEHDREHGVKHLLNWAIDYSRRGKAVESSSLIHSAMSLLDEPVPADEREALATVIGHAIYGKENWETTHDVDPHPWGYLADEQDNLAGRVAEAVSAAGFHRQGPITDADLERIWDVFARPGYFGTREGLRAALEAARDAS